MDSPAPADLSGYSPPTSLWKLVKNTVPEHELEEFQSMLGASLVEQSLELHEEIETWLQIWRDYREESSQLHATPKRLPEPPAVRERLRQEISFFVNRIRARSSSSNSEHVLAKHNTDVLSYVMDQKRPESSGYFSRPSTAASSIDGRETPRRLGTPTSDRFSQSSILSEEVDSMSDKLNVLKFDEVTAHLRETLEEEIEYLLMDIKFLQGCLEDEACLRSQTSMSFEEPSLSELRTERNKLEKDLLECESPIPEVLRSKSSIKAKPALGSLSSPSSRLPAQIKLHPRKPSSGRSRSSPVKASHPMPTSQVVNIDDLKQTESAPTHVTIRVGSSGCVETTSRLVKVGVARPQRINDGHAGATCFVPTPPCDGRQTRRPSSANRFRKMVIGCRDHDENQPIGGAS